MSARLKGSSAEQETPGVLPLPAEVVAHHGAVLFGPMKEWQNQKRIPPVLLLTGAPGVGKRSMSYFLAQWILCDRTGLNARAPEEDGGDLFGGGGLFGEAPAPAPVAAAPVDGDPVPCGECTSCQRAMRGTWIDFTEFGANEDDESETLKIESFRKLKSQQGFGAHEGNYRVILIPNADRMTVQAANSVLKLLEEPPKGWIFFLTAGDSNLLLPTIVSRCQTIRLKPFSRETLEALLGADRGRRALCAELAQGSWGKALDLASMNDEVWKKRELLVGLLREPQTAIGPLVDWASTDTLSFERMIDQLENLTLDLIRWSLDPALAAPEKHMWVNHDAGATLASHARTLSGATAAGAARARAFWLERAERLARARHELSIPLNRKLLAQDILIPWAATPSS